MANELGNTLFLDLSKLIETARTQVAHYANSTLVKLYWQIGHRFIMSFSKKNVLNMVKKLLNKPLRSLALLMAVVLMTVRYSEWFDLPDYIPIRK